MYPVLKDDSAKRLFHRRMTHDHDDKHNIEYVPPPVVKDLTLKNTFVHNCIQNKNKVNVEHFDKIFNKKVFSNAKWSILKRMHEDNIDFRMLTSFKNALFDSEELTDNHLLPVSEWTQIKSYEMPHSLKPPLEKMILDEICSNDTVNLMKFTDIVDLFFYLPMQKEILKNDSHDIYYIMSSNVQGFSKVGAMKDQGGKLAGMLDLLWIKIAERFKGVAEAYRYFDVNFNNRVSFSEFQKGLDHLRIKYQVN